jgi:hypothetical protein
VLQLADRYILQEAARISPEFARKYSISRPVGDAFVEQNNIPVTSVQPGTPIQLYANSYPGGYFNDTLFLVTDSNNTTVLGPIKVGVDFVGNAWYDWKAPTTEGSYTFYSNSDSRGNNFATFTVSKDAPNPGDQKTKTTNWLLYGGIALGAMALFMVFMNRK